MNCKYPLHNALRALVGRMASTTRLGLAGLMFAIELALVTGIAADDEAEPAVPAGEVSDNRTEPTRCPLVIFADDVRPHVEYLASEELQGRDGDSARVAAEYIAAHFDEAGLEPLFESSYFQNIPDGVPELQVDAKDTCVGRNVGAWLPGTDPELADEFIIISAHYDHLGVRGGRIYPGADDNASGVSMLLETADWFAQEGNRPKRSLAFVAFDLEEEMLWGSRWFAAHPPWPIEQVKLFITADMIGRSLGGLPLPMVFVMGSEYATASGELLDAAGTPEGLEVARLGVDLIGKRSDYGAFWDRQIPFLFFSTGEHPDYHSPNDTPDRVEYDRVAQISSLIAAIVTRAGDSDEVPVWSDDVQVDVSEAKTINLITTHLLEADEQGDSDLGDVQRVFVSQLEAKTAYIVERGTMSGEERAWLIRACQLLLFSVL
jgi:hypothetical protein